MRRPRRSSAERLFLLKQAEQSQKNDKRRRSLYNKRYRKSIFFISVWAGRLIYIILFFLLIFFHEKSGGFREETVINISEDSFNQSSRRGSYKVTNLYIETNYKKYESEFINNDPPQFKIGDTLLIERNLFHKPIYFTKSDWNIKYYIYSNIIFYYMILFLTFISLFFNDGLDRFTDKILLITWFINIIAMAVYFFT